MSRISTAALSCLLLLLASCSGGTDPDPESVRLTSDAAAGHDVLQELRPAESVENSVADDRQVTADEQAAEEPSTLPSTGEAEGVATVDRSVATQKDEEAATPNVSASRADLGSTSDEIGGDLGTKDDPIPLRETLVGRWEFVICQFGADILGMLIEIKKDGDAFAATIVDDSSMMPGWTITAAEVSGKHASIDFTSHDGTSVNFEGSLHADGVVRGNVMKHVKKLTSPVRLMATRRESLDDAEPKIPSLGVEKMQGFKPDRDNAIAQLREKVADLGNSALAYELARRLSAVFRGARPPEARFRGFPEQYLAAAEPWGKRMTDKARLDIAYTMAVCGYSIVEAAKHLSAVEAALAETPSAFDDQRVTTARGLIDLQSNDEQRQQLAMQTLEQLRNDSPFETNVALGLAAYHERNQKLEQALELYAELAALPTGAGDMKPVKRLWQELGRDADQLERYLDRLYRERAHVFAADQSDAPRAEGRQQTILGELFTGTTCRPCVAADVATGGLETTFPASEFIMLRYHQHIPGPDPLAVEVGKERAFSYYGIKGTPSLFFNGRPIRIKSMYGAIRNAPNGYGDLRKIVEELLVQSSDLHITLDASTTHGAVNIKASVAGSSGIPHSWRLRLVLAEDEIFFKAPNGVRLHSMVVREMPGGAEGIAPVEGQLEYTGSVSLDELRTQIDSEISQIANLPRPPMNFSHLSVVAFVQDDSNRRVLQATTVPVMGLARNAHAPGPAMPDETERVNEPQPKGEKPETDRSDTATSD